MTSTPSLLPMYQFMHWAGVFSFYFMLFWSYVPFAVAAQELLHLNRRYP